MRSLWNVEQLSIASGLAQLAGRRRSYIRQRICLETASWRKFINLNTQNQELWRTFERELRGIRGQKHIKYAQHVAISYETKKIGLNGRTQTHATSCRLLQTCARERKLMQTCKRFANYFPRKVSEFAFCERKRLRPLPLFFMSQQMYVANRRKNHSQATCNKPASECCKQ